MTRLMTFDPVSPSYLSDPRPSTHGDQAQYCAWDLPPALVGAILPNFLSVLFHSSYCSSQPTADAFFPNINFLFLILTTNGITSTTRPEMGNLK